jgi:hypothetical protein
MQKKREDNLHWIIVTQTESNRAIATCGLKMETARKDQGREKKKQDVSWSIHVIIVLIPSF